MKHWPPETVARRRPRRTATGRRGWRSLGEQGDRLGPGTVSTVLLGAVFLGLVAGLGPELNWPQTGGWSDAAIEWNAVQAPPTRALDADEIEWQRRGMESESAGATAELRPSTGSGRTAAGARASFGLCHTGGGTNCVIDGDTFYLNGDKVRIVGIDAPETHPPRCAEEARLGEAATGKLRALLNSGAVTMTRIDRDRDIYGRLLRNVQIDGRDVGEAMIGAGVARAYGSGRRDWC